MDSNVLIALLGILGTLLATIVSPLVSNSLNEISLKNQMKKEYLDKLFDINFDFRSQQGTNLLDKVQFYFIRNKKVLDAAFKYKSSVMQWMKDNSKFTDEELDELLYNLVAEIIKDINKFTKKENFESLKLYFLMK